MRTIEVILKDEETGETAIASYTEEHFQDMSVIEQYYDTDFLTEVYNHLCEELDRKKIMKKNE